MFLKSILCSPRVILFDQKYSKNNIVKHYYKLNNKKTFKMFFLLMSFISMMAKLNFQ